MIQVTQEGGSFEDRHFPFLYTSTFLHYKYWILFGGVPETAP